MDPKKLHKASLYINNLLLSRGLLRDGVPIDFVAPSPSESASEGASAKIINLVHDLILRRDVSLPGQSRALSHGMWLTIELIL